MALHSSTARIALSISSYFAGLAVGQLFYGPLLDRFGRKRPLYAGLTLFMVASLLCLRARTVEWLVAHALPASVGRLRGASRADGDGARFLSCA